MDYQEVDKMKAEIIEQYKILEKKFREAVKQISDILKLFGMEGYCYEVVSEHQRFEILDGYILVSNDDYNGELSPIDDTKINENIENKSLEWIIRHSNMILDFLINLPLILKILPKHGYDHLKCSYETLKDKYSILNKKEDLK